MPKSKDDEHKLSVRIAPEIDEMIDRLVEKTGQNKTQVVNRLLNPDSANIEIIDGTKIAASLFNIQCLLKKLPDDDSVRVKVEAACDLLTQELYDLFNKGGNSNGNSESDKC